MVVDGEGVRLVGARDGQAHHVVARDLDPLRRVAVVVGRDGELAPVRRLVLGEQPPPAAGLEGVK